MEDVTVIVPVYNGEKRVAGCVNSLLAQTYGDFVIYLVDDGSKDHSYKKCQEIKKETGDPRIRILKKPHGGVDSAVMTGLNNTKTPFVTFVDADDTVEPQYVETLRKNMEGHDMSGCSYESKKTDQTWWHHVQPGEYDAPAIESTILVPFFKQAGEQVPCCGSGRWSKMYRTDLLTQVYGEKKGDMNYGEGLETVLRYLHKAKSIALEDAVLYSHILHRLSVSHSAYGKDVTDERGHMVRMIRTLADDWHIDAVSDDARLYDSLAQYVYESLYRKDAKRNMKTLKLTVEKLVTQLAKMPRAYDPYIAQVKLPYSTVLKEYKKGEFNRGWRINQMTNALKRDDKDDSRDNPIEDVKL